MSSWFGGSKKDAKEQSSDSSSGYDNHIQAYYQKQQQKVDGYEQLNRLTEECWDKCIRDVGGSSDLSAKERKCLSLCASRWIDTVKIVEDKQNSFLTTPKHQ